MAHARVRTWTLATLDQDQAYRLYFDRASSRWEVAPLEGGAPLTTRAARADGGAAKRAGRQTGTDAAAAEHRTDTGPADQ